MPRKSDIILGKSLSFLPWHDVRLNAEEQGYHSSIFGQTGSGKSKLLQSLFLQHMRLGHGVCMIDPHHDLAYDTLISLIAQGFFQTKEAFKKLIYIDWGNGAFVPFNILKVKKRDGSDEDQETISGNVVDGFSRSFPEVRNAPNFKTYMTASVETLIANGLPLPFIFPLLVNPVFRRHCLQKVTDHLIHMVFQMFERVKDPIGEVSSTLKRAYLISHNSNCRYTLGQQDNLLDFQSIMDEGVAIIINLGNIKDKEVMRLIGSLLLVQIEQAAQTRSQILRERRLLFPVLLDEWQLFAAGEETISGILSQCRKYRLPLYLATQSSSGIDSVRLERALENCKLNIVFGLGRASAVHQAGQIASIDFASLKEEAKTQTQHALFTSIPEQFEAWAQDIQNLDTRKAYVKILQNPSVKMKTIHVPDLRVSQSSIEQVLKTYKALYQRERNEASIHTTHSDAIAYPLLQIGDSPLDSSAYRYRKRRGVR